jgi:acyl-CoA synthetase (AMP-forming)/AMP-acid ligase II
VDIFAKLRERGEFNVHRELEMLTRIEPLPRGTSYPHPLHGISRGPDGIARYDHLPASLIEMLRYHTERRPGADAVIEVDGERLSYLEFWDRSARVAGGLRARGIARGDRVANRLTNGIAWAEAFFGTILAGAVVVPVNTRFAEPEVEYVVSDSGSTFVFLPGEALPQGEPYVDETIGPDDTAAIFYTSGTTGFPKGALTTHAAFLSNCESMARSLRLPLEDGEPLRTLISVPLFHVTGCNSQLLTMLYVGGASVIMPAMDVGLLLRTTAAEQINFLVTVPAVYALMLQHPEFARTDLGCVKRVGYGGAPIAPELVHRLKAAFPNGKVFNGFGMTETASLVTSLPDDFAEEHADSVGFVVPVDDLALEGVDPVSGVGELLIRGPNVTRAYWNKPEATELAILDGGWLRSGDLACVDAEGLVYIVDRAKDMINRGGENVYCVEVENALAGAPGIAETAVIGVPDPVMGEKVGVVLVPLPGVVPDVPAIIGWLQGKVADFKIPQYAAIRETPLPRNPGGKVLKPVLRRETEWGKPLR